MKNLYKITNIIDTLQNLKINEEEIINFKLMATTFYYKEYLGSKEENYLEKTSWITKG